jgi:hypothetical protein
LIDTIALVDVATTGASLTTVAGIDKLNRDAFVRCFVGNKALQLAKTPIAHSPTLFTTSFGTLTDVCQDLHHQGIPWLARGNNVLGDDVICVCLKSFQFARELFQVSLSRLCTFALQSTSEAEVTVIGFFDALAAKETRVRGHGKAIDAKINTDHLTLSSGRDRSLFTRDNHVQPVGTFAKDQISAILLPFLRQVLLIVGRDLDIDKSTIAGHALLLHMYKGNHASVAIKAEGMRIIADSTQIGVRRFSKLQGLHRFGCFLGFFQALLVFLDLLLTSCYHALDRLCSLDTGGTDQLRGKMGSRTMVRIRQAVQFDAVADFLGIGKLAHFIKASGVLVHRLLQKCCLLRSWLEWYAYCTCHYHVHIVALCGTEVNYWKGVAFPPAPEGSGYPRPNCS